MNPNTYPANISKIQERGLVARIQVETMTGRHWFLVEIENVFERRCMKMASANVLPLATGHTPEIFAEATHGGWAYSSSADVLVSQLHDVAMVEGGKVVEYLGRPFAKSRPLAAPVEWTAEQILQREA